MRWRENVGRCQWCNGAVIHKPAYFPNPSRDYCHSCGREQRVVSNNLDPQKEEEVKALLRDHSVREIIKETGVAKNTVARIMKENLTEEERKVLKKEANVRGRHKRENPLNKIQKKFTKRIPRKSFEPNKSNFGDIAKKQFEFLEKRYEELAQHIKAECTELIKIGYQIAGLDEYLSFLKSADELTTDEGWKQYLEQTNDELYAEKKQDEIQKEST
jgi:hypothetical protein